MIYEDLKNQFNNLSLEEKNALLVYKSGLGLVINDLENKYLIEEYYNRYKNIINDPKNLTIKYSIFSKIDFTNIDTFINSIKDVAEITNNAIQKLSLNENITVYRAFSSNNIITSLAKTKIISTSMSFFETLKFITEGNIYLYEIELPANSLVGIIPYSIKYNNKTKIISVNSDDNQEEILLSNDLYDFNKIEEYKIDNLKEDNTISNDSYNFNIIKEYKKNINNDITIIKCSAVMKDILKR